MTVYKLIGTIFLSLLVSISAIGQSQDEAFIDFGSVYFEEGEEKLLDGELLSGSMKIDFSSSGDLYLLDLRINKVYVYDENLKLKFSFGAQGRGPGEFERASDMYLSDSEVFIIDSALLRVNRFSMDGEWLDSFNIDFRSIDMAVLGNVACLHTGGVVPKDQQSVKCYDKTSGEFIKSLIGTSEVIGDRPVGFANSSFDMIQSKNDKMTVLQHPLDATISVFDENLDQVDQFVIENEIFEQPSFPENFSPLADEIKDYASSSIAGIYVQDEVLFVMFIEMGTGNKFLDLWNLKGQRLTEGVINLEIRYPKYVDEKGNLYSFSYADNQDGINLKIYKTKYE